MANYHPSDELLMAFAAGQLANALGVMVACHLEHCESCKAKVRMYEQVGGELIHHTANDASDVSMKDSALSQLLESIDKPFIEQAQPQGDSRIPSPLRRFIPDYYDKLAWTGFSSSIKEFQIPIADQGFTAKLYKIAAGKELPEHTHRGNEFTLVMDGSFTDDAGSYNRGDFILADTTTVHQPKATNDADCICFAVMDAPLKMTGFWGRMLNPFMS